MFLIIQFLIFRKKINWADFPNNKPHIAKAYLYVADEKRNGHQFNWCKVIFKVMESKKVGDKENKIHLDSL